MEAHLGAAAATRPAQRSTPTEEELMRTFPPGYSGDPSAEATAAPAPTPEAHHRT